MAFPDSFPLSKFLAEGAAALPQAQSALDSAWVESCDAFFAAFAPFPGEHRALVAPLLPARQVIRHFEVNSDYLIQKESSASTIVQIAPATLAFERRFARSQSHCQNIQFQVVAHPFIQEKTNG